MMKRIGACLLLAVATMAVAIIASCLPVDGETRRVHQHLTYNTELEPGAADGAFSTHLPLVIIATGGQAIPGEILRGADGMVVINEYGHSMYTTAADGSEDCAVSVAVIANDGAANHLADPPELKTMARMRIRGNSSRHFDKKSYLLKFINEDGTKNWQTVMGMDRHEEWALHGPYLDKTLLRNYMWYNIAGEIMGYAPNCRFCEVFIDGAYQGLYLMTETITNGRNSRLNLTEPLSDTLVGGYCLRMDREEADDVGKLNVFGMYAYKYYSSMTISYPGVKLTAAMAQSIHREVSDFEKALYSYDYDDDTYGYERLLDPDSFAQYLLINELTANYDAMSFSTYIYKELDGRYRLCVWDFNNCCDNYIEKKFEADEDFTLMEQGWYFMLSKDEDFIRRTISHYRKLRQTYLSEEYLENYIDQVCAYLGPAVERNFQMWGSSFGENGNLLRPEERNLTSFAAAIAQYKTYLRERGAWMDENIEVLLQFCHDSKIKKFDA